MSFWQDKKVLVTGADGFVGSNLVKTLIEKKSKVTTFSRRGVAKQSLLILAGFVGKIANQEKGSIRDFNRLCCLIKKRKIDIIFHLAAQPLVEIGQESLIPTFEVNIRGTWNLLEAARISQVKKVIIASTAHVYGDNPNLPFREEYFPQPSRPYETSKACADLLAQSYADTYRLSIEIPRFVNLYGPGDFNFSRIVPKVIRAIIQGEDPAVWNVGAVRDFLYIDDAINAYLLLAEKKLPDKKRTRIWNFGTGKPIGVVALVKKIIKLADNKRLKVDIRPIPDHRAKEVLKQYVSIKKAREILGWKPKTGLNKGLQKTLEWYKRYL